MNQTPFSDADLVDQPLAEASTIPSAWYTEEEYVALDLKTILFNSWQYVGPLNQLSKPGDFLTATVAGNPIIVLRDKANVLQGYFNVCKHRGGPLETKPCGSVRMLQCKYHGWTYKLDGSLRGVPRFERTELFDKKDFGLESFRVDTWGGLVFADLSGQAEPLEKTFGGISERIAPADIAAFTYHNRVHYDVKCNWKAYVDNYLEGYHLPLVHPELCDALDYADYVTETFDSYSLQHSSFRDAADERAFYYFVYPNIMLNILPGRLQVNTIIPKDASHTEVVFDYFYADATSPEALTKIESDQAFADKVQWEDIDICEHVQKGLESVAYDKGRFSVETEAGVHHFQSLLKKSYRRYLQKER